ncbi:MAG: VWA domain-containing protein [Oscillospiraceae bacterium]|nr:VWA domain-containing protein [Oscillospiraceae bacterium]
MRKRILAIVMAVCMMLSVLPTSAFADDYDTDNPYTHEESASSDDNAVQVTKTVTYDGSAYKISLEAFVTGTVTSTSTSTPLDIVLVVDQSGSMAYNDDSSSTNNEEDRRYYALKSAMNTFVSTIANDAKENEVDHRIAIVGYAANATSSASSNIAGIGITSGSSSSSWINTGIYIDGTMKNYQTLTYTEVYSNNDDFSTSSTYYVLVDGTYYSVSYNNGGQGGQQQQTGWYYSGQGGGNNRTYVTPNASEDDTSGTQFYKSEYVDLTADDYKASLVSAYDTDNSGVTSSITTAISNIAVSGGTYTEYGLLMAQGVFYNNSATYTYTDDNGEEQTGTRKRIVVLFTDGETNSDISDVLTASNALKSSTYNATVYTVGFGSSVDEDFLTHVSSNYGSDTSCTTTTTGTGPNQTTTYTYSGTYNNTDGYYLAASNSSALSSVFETIASEAVASSVTVDSSSVLTDTLSGYFTLPDTVTSDSGVTVYKVPVTNGTLNDDGTRVHLYMGYGGRYH